MGDTLGIGNSLRGLGNVYFEEGDYAQARQCYTDSLRLTQELAEADKLYQSMGITPAPVDQARREHWLAKPRQVLGAAAAAVWNAGQRVSTEQAIMYALAG